MLVFQSTLNATMMRLQLNLKQCPTSPATLQDDDNESSKDEEQTALTGLKTMKEFFLCNELLEDSLKKLL